MTDLFTGFAGDAHAVVGVAGGTGPSATPLLELRNVSKRYGSIQALADVSLTLGRGELLGLVGENGAGKSTLSGVASGLVTPDSGSILVEGQTLKFSGPADAEEAGISIAPQELQLCPNLTVAENVMLGELTRNRWGRIDMGTARRRSAERLERLSLSSIDVDRRVESLSVVDRAFVQIARALAPGAKVLIADEPTAPMSSREADRLLDLLEAIRSTGVGVIFISHRLDEVLRLNDRTMVLRDGQVVDEMTAATGTRDRLVRSMLGTRRLAAGGPSASTSAGQSQALIVDGLANKRTLRSVSLTVDFGEIVGVYGIAGSGRDELGPAIFGASPTVAGTLHIGEQPLERGSVDRSIKAGVGYVPAERRSQGLLLDRSVRENLSLVALPTFTRVGVVDRQREADAVDNWIEQLSIKTPTPQTPVRSLSGGNQQKVLLARWLLAGSEVLILDDPTRGVDVGSKEEIYGLLRILAYEHGRAILVITSDLEEVAALCERVYVMTHGRIRSERRAATQEQLAHDAFNASEVQL